MAEPVDRDRHRLLEAITGNGVHAVLIGGAAIQSHGVDYRTQDIDLTPQRTQENLSRLADALNDLHCKLVIDPADDAQNVPLPEGYFTAAVLARQDIWNLMTDHGKVDITFHPSGFERGYDALIERAEPRTVAATEQTVPVAALDDVEHSKRTANRAKDREYLEGVGRLTAPGDPELADIKRIHQANTPTPPTASPPQGRSACSPPSPHRPPGPAGRLER